MNGPFSRSYFTQQPSRSARTVPVQQTQPQKSPVPKVISVPVHFVSSDRLKTTSLMLKDSSALEIQKVFRGFLVRKSVKKIVSIRNEVIEIERKLNNEIGFFNSIRTDAKERLRVNETLMSLLFKLDSIHGVDFGVRVLRKSVTNKAIALQEKVDSIGQQTLDSSNDTSVSESNDNCNTNQVTENHESSMEEIDAKIVKEDLLGQQTQDSSNNNSVSEIDNNYNTEHVTESNHDSSFGEFDDEIVKEVDENCINRVDYMKEEDEGGLIEKNENREVMKKLMDDNEKMMKLMKKISETNEMQTRTIQSLTGRVQQLEKAFMIDRIRKLKNKKNTRR